MSGKKCNHTVAMFYGEEFGACSGGTISISNIVDNPALAEELKDDNKYETFSYCPYCGDKLERSIKKAVKKGYSEISKAELAKKVERETRLEEREYRVQEILSSGMFSLLNEDINYIARFSTPVDDYENKRILTAGSLRAIALGLDFYLSQRGKKIDFLTLVEAILIPSRSDLLEGLGDVFDYDEKEKIFSKKLDKSYINFSYCENDGFVYLEEFKKDSWGDEYSNYVKYTIDQFIEIYDINLKLIKLEL